MSKAQIVNIVATVCRLYKNKSSIDFIETQVEALLSKYGLSTPAIEQCSVPKKEKYSICWVCNGRGTVDDILDDNVMCDTCKGKGKFSAHVLSAQQIKEAAERLYPYDVRVADINIKEGMAVRREQKAYIAAFTAHPKQPAQPTLEDQVRNAVIDILQGDYIHTVKSNADIVKCVDKYFEYTEGSEEHDLQQLYTQADEPKRELYNALQRLTVRFKDYCPKFKDDWYYKQAVKALGKYK